MRLNGKHVAVTGASSGIGEAIARELAHSGARLTLIARRGDLLHRLARELGGETFVQAQDLCDVERSTDWIKPAVDALGPIDVLVNNAGMQHIGKSWEVPDEDVECLMRLNLLTPLRLTRA